MASKSPNPSERLYRSAIPVTGVGGAHIARCPGCGMSPNLYMIINPHGWEVRCFNSTCLDFDTETFSSEEQAVLHWNMVAALLKNNPLTKG